MDWSGTSSRLQPVKNCPERTSVMIVVDCRTARPMVRYRVYCVSLAVPDCPSLWRASKRGITTRSSWMMIDAVM